VSQEKLGFNTNRKWLFIPIKTGPTNPRIWVNVSRQTAFNGPIAGAGSGFLALGALNDDAPTSAELEKLNKKK
jgi:hypothetical protein